LVISLSGLGDPPHLHSFPTRRSSDLERGGGRPLRRSLGEARAEWSRPAHGAKGASGANRPGAALGADGSRAARRPIGRGDLAGLDRKSTRLNSSHVKISYAVFCLKKK